MRPGRPIGSRTRSLLIFLAFAVPALGLIAAAVWWFGPWSRPYRYSHMDLVSLRRVLDDDPKNALAARLLALRLAHDGDAGMAEPALRQALALSPNDPELATGLGELWLSTDRYPEAFQILKRTTEQSPRYTEGHMALGRLYKHKASYQHAATQFETVVAQDRTYTEAWYQLAICYLQMQQAAKAQAAIAEALRQSPHDPQFLALQGSIDVALGNVDAGIATTKTAADLAPHDIKIQTALINLLLSDHRNDADLDLAEQVIGRLEELDPEYPLLPYQRGELERLRQHWQAAARYLERAVQTVPGQDEVYYSLAQTYRRLNRTQDADRMMEYYRRRQDLRRRIDAVQIALGSQPNSATLYTQLGELQLQYGQRADALNSFQTALDLDPHFAPAKDWLRRLQAPGGASQGHP